MKNFKKLTMYDENQEVATSNKTEPLCDLVNIIPRYTHRKRQVNENYSVMEIGEIDNPRSHPNEWCDRRICEGFWGNEEMAIKVVALLNGV